MPPFDRSIIECLNSFAYRSVPFDVLAVPMSCSHMLRGGFAMVMSWWAWIRRTGADTR